MFEKLINMLVKKEYKKVNQRYVGLDTWGNPKYEYEWKTEIKISKNALVVVSAIGAAIGLIISSFVAFKGLSGSFEETTTTVVEETTTTTVVTTTTVEVYGDIIYGPEYVAPAPKVEWVCDTPTTSDEWKLIGVGEWSDLEIDWKEMAAREVVFEWKAGDILLPAFEKAVEMFIEYTRANVRVESEGYLAVDGEDVIPVNKVPSLGDFAAHVVRYYDESQVKTEIHPTLRYLYTAGMLRAGETYMEIDSKMEDEGYEYTLVNMFLHEIGHVYGLDHTHEEEGEQVDSVMSYESDPSVSHYLPGDIAGLKEVFC